MEGVEDLGKIITLMTASDVHKRWTLESTERLIAPPMTLGQYMLVSDRADFPVAFATWAFLNEEAERGYLTRTRKLQPEDWDDGDRLWIVDFVAPYGDVHGIVKLLQKEISKELPDDFMQAHIARVGKDGKVRRVGVFPTKKRQYDA